MIEDDDFEDHQDEPEMEPYQVLTIKSTFLYTACPKRGNYNLVYINIMITYTMSIATAVEEIGVQIV